jgi:hypothetical protein
MNDDDEIELQARMDNDTIRGITPIDAGDEDECCVAGGNSEQQRQGLFYQTVPNTEGDNGDEIVVLQTEDRWQRLWSQPLLSDQSFSLAGVKLLDGPAAVKLLKFFILTVLGIVSWFGFVRWVVSSAIATSTLSLADILFACVSFIICGRTPLLLLQELENDYSLTLGNIWVYESNFIIVDVLFFFVVGRLHRQRGVDHLAWVTWAILANLYSSYITSFRFLQHSFSLYEMHCTWPLELWMFVALAAVLVVGIILAHVKFAVRAGIFFQKLIELGLAVALLLMPLLSSPYFHFHHWFAGWLVGMHFNFDVWWSRSAMAWCWGCYINGIAVYGRDPVLTCGYAYYVSVSQDCPFMKCYLEGIHKHSNSTSNHTDVEPMLPPDWRNCSANTYHS